MKFLVMLAVVVFFVAVGPLLIIWGLNTLFPVLDIAYTLETWAAAFIVSSVFSSKVKVGK